MRSISVGVQLFLLMFYPPEGRCVAYPVGVQLFLLMFYFFGLGNELWKKKKVTVVVWFWRSFFLKMFYCAGGRTDGWTGGRVDGEQKGPLIFFILRYIKHYTHIYSYTKEKLSGQISCGFKILDKLGVRRNKIKNTLLVGFFKNQSKSNIFIKEITC